MRTHGSSRLRLKLVIDFGCAAGFQKEATQASEKDWRLRKRDGGTLWLQEKQAKLNVADGKHNSTSTKPFVAKTTSRKKSWKFLRCGFKNRVGTKPWTHLTKKLWMGFMSSKTHRMRWTQKNCLNPWSRESTESISDRHQNLVLQQTGRFCRSVSVQNIDEESVTQKLFSHTVKVNEAIDYITTFLWQILGFAPNIQTFELLLPFLDQACVCTHEE